MGVYIPNMEIPRTCYECDSDFASSFGCEEWWGWVFPEGKEKRSPDCPLIDIVTCGECKWWDKDGDRPIGYCHAEKHCYFSTNWEISIYRTYKSDHFCSDGERRSE